MNFSAVAYTYARFPLILRLFLLVAFLLILAGIAIHYIEPETFPSIFDGIWWAIVTASTVGYGDYAPVTKPGRLLGFFVILFGIGIVSFFVTAIASATITTRNALSHGDLASTSDDHFIIIGWNERAKNIISHLMQINPQMTIVLIDQTLKQLPLRFKQLHFVRGNPLEDRTLTRANVTKAKTVVITANFHGHEAEADTRSIITLLTIKGLNPAIYSIVELLTPEQKNNCLRAGADEIIESSLFASLAIVNSTIYHGISQVIRKLLDQQKNHMLYYDELSSKLVGKTYAESIAQVTDQQKLILGVIRHNQLLLPPNPAFVLQSGDKFVVIQTEEANC